MAKKKASKKAKFNLLPVVAGGAGAVVIAAGIIVGVNVPKKVTFEEFKNAANNVEAAPYTKVSVKGNYVNSDGAKVTVNDELAKALLFKIGSLESTVFTADKCDTKGYAYANTTVSSFAISESENVEYYSGNWGFKVVQTDDEGNKQTYSFNEYGYITSVKADDLSYNLTWKK